MKSVLILFIIALITTPFVKSTQISSRKEKWDGLSRFLNNFSEILDGLIFCAEGFIHDLLTPMEPIPADAYRTIPEMVMVAGYEYESHKIVSQDGYINTVWRIVGKIEDQETEPERKPPVILQHGLMDDSFSWFLVDANKALPYMLVDQGYDVWLTNARGNIFSYEHLKSEIYNVKKRDSDYFKFTWDEIAKYDTPAALNYILRHSNYEKVFYVGISQGTTTFFAAADIVEGLSDKIAGFVGYAPVMYIGNITNPFVWLAVDAHLADLFLWIRQYNLFLNPEETSWILRLLGAKFSTFLGRCMSLILGRTEKMNFDLSRVPVFLNHQPAGTSIFNMIHWLQGILSGEFKMYDFGTESENMKHYGAATPPLYNTTRIAETFSKFPSLIFAGEKDALVDSDDLSRLQDLLKETETEFVKVPDYNHGDYIASVDCNEKVFIPTVDFILKHTDSLERH